MRRETMWLVGMVATILAVGGSKAAWDLADVRTSVLAWGAGLVDRPISGGTGDPVLNRRLLFEIDAVGVDKPTVLARALTAHAQWWRTAARASVVLERPDADGARAMRVVVDCMRPEHSHRVRLKGDAHPIECPDPSPTRACYHTGRDAKGTVFHAILILDRGDDDQVKMSVDVLGLGDGASIFRAHGGPLRHLDGHTMFDTLRTIAEASDVGLPVHPADFNRWAIRSHATLTAYPDGLVDDYHVARRRRGPSFISRWRAANAHLMGYALSPSARTLSDGAPTRARAKIAMTDPVLTWGAGVVTRPDPHAPSDPVVHRRLVFTLADLSVDTPASISAALTHMAQQWRTTSDAVLTLETPYRDGARGLRLETGADVGELRTVRDMAHPVVCPDPAKARTCYHAGLSVDGILLHMLLTLEHDGVDVHLHADVLALTHTGALIQGGPRIETKARARRGVIVEGMAEGTLDLERSTALDYPHPFAADATPADRLAAPRWVHHPERSKGMSLVERWRARVF